MKTLTTTTRSRGRRSRLTEIQDLAVALEECRWDVELFAKRFLGVNLHRGQKRMARRYLQRNHTGWRALWLWLIISAGNRAGKTLGLAVIIIHACVFKMGMEPPHDDVSANRWSKLPYFWFHFAVQQEIAELVYTEIVNLMSGSHPAQKDGPGIFAAAHGTSEPVAEWDRKYNGDYRWIKFSEQLGGAEIHFRTTGEKAIGSLGRDMHGISFDEVGFEKNLNFIVNEVLHLRRMGTGGQFVLISTPSEDIGPLFADLWYTGDPAAPDRKKNRYSMRMSTRDNVGYGLDAEVFEEMVADLPEELVPQNIDGYFIQGRSVYFNASSVDRCFKIELPERMAARRTHVYVQGVDSAIRVDSSWSIVLDLIWWEGRVYAIGVHCERLRGKQTTPALVALAASAHNAYDNPRLGTRCSTAIDATGYGGKMFREALEAEVPTVRSIEFGGTTAKKRKLLGDVRTMMDEGRLLLPRHGVWMHVRRQLLGYKIDDRSIEQDAVMALACAIAEVRRAVPNGVGGLDFDFHATADNELPENDGRRWAKTPYRRQHT